MFNILKNLCKNLNIELSYTNNKIVILSCNSVNNHPVIRAHKIFIKCNDDIAYAIIDYYTKTEKREENLEIIKKYANKKLNSKRYRIIPPDDEFYNEVVKATMLENSKQNEKSHLIELNVTSLTKKSFYGNSYDSNLDEPIKVSKNDMMEVTIVVDPFNT